MKIHLENTDALNDQILMTNRKRSSLVNVTEQILSTYEQLRQLNGIPYKIGNNHEPKSDRYVIKGINPGANSQAIQSDLEHLSFKVINVSNMTSWVTNKSLLVYFTVLEDSPGHEEIIGL